MADKGNSTLLLWGGIAYGPLGWLYLGVRFLISFLLTTLLVIWDLLATIFLIFWKVITDIYPFLLIVAIIFLVLLIIHLEWAHFVDFLNKIFLPLLQIIIDDFLRFIWNDLFIPLWNIVVQLWDSLVQIIGFFIYFALNMFVTVVNIIIELIGEIDLPAIFEDIMEIVTPIVKLATEILKVLINVGSALIQKIIPIVIAILKIVFEFIKIIFEIIAWLLITLFRILKPILELVVDVVNVVVSIFNLSAGARVLMSVDFSGAKRSDTSSEGKAPNGFTGFYKSGPSSLGGVDAGEFLLNKLYIAATREYTLGQYEKMFDSLNWIHTGIVTEDVYHSQNGYYLEPGGSVPDYTHHLYGEEDLENHERRGTHTGTLPEDRPLSEDSFEQIYEEEEDEILDMDSGVQPAGGQVDPILSKPNKRDLKAAEWKGIDVSKLDPTHATELEKTRAEFLESLKEPIQEATPEQTAAAKEEEEQWASIAEFVEHFTSYQVKKSAKTSKKNKDEAAGPRTKKVNPLRSKDPYKDVHPDDHWRVDYTHNMTSDQVFKKKVKRPRMEDLHPKPSPKQLHEKRKRAVAYAHAIQSAYVRVYKKHISNKHLHRAVASSFKHLTGHDSFHSFFKKFQSDYVSPAHFLYSVVPSTHDKGFFKYLWQADPDYEKRPPFHLAIEREFQTKNISRQYWEHIEALAQAKEAGLAHDETSTDSDHGPIPTQQAAARKLLMDFFGGLKINLEILYEDDCFTTPRRNILCLPFIPTWWTIPFINLTSVVLTRDLNHNPACEPVWKSTDCILCWAGVWNTIQEFRFSLYFLDLLSIILIFGIFTPRPTEYIGYLGKIFPPLSPIVDMILIYQPGVFPNGQQWACYFINFFYLYEGFIALLIIYYVVDPLWEWFMRTYRNYQSLIVVYRMRLMARRQGMEIWDESLLASTNEIYFTRDQKMRRNNWRSYTNINSEIGGKTTAAQGSEVKVRVSHPKGTQSTSDYIRRQRIAEGNQKEMIELTRYEMDIERTRARIAARMDQIASRLGAKYEREDENSASRKRKATKVWQFVTSVMQIPHQATPVYSQHLERYQRLQHQHTPPPGVDAFPSPYSSILSAPTTQQK